MSRARPRPILTQQDWIDAGQAILREEGVTGVKLTPLLKRLGVTSGSFYHHFADFQSYLEALADFYGTDNFDRVRAAVDEADSPTARLVALRQLMDDWDVPALDRAMRVWAASNPRAAAAVRTLDAELLKVLVSSLVELGFDEDEARVRALLMYSAGAGYALVFPPWPADAADVSRALELLMTPTAPRPTPGS